MEFLLVCAGEVISVRSFLSGAGQMDDGSDLGTIVAVEAAPRMPFAHRFVSYHYGHLVRDNYNFFDIYYYETSK